MSRAWNWSRIKPGDRVAVQSSALESRALSTRTSTGRLAWRWDARSFAPAEKSVQERRWAAAQRYSRVNAFTENLPWRNQNGIHNRSVFHAHFAEAPRLDRSPHEVFMHRVRTRQHALVQTAMVTAAVAAAVLFWGTAYKCSLYRKHPEKHARVAVAKLLSEWERPDTIQTTAPAQLPVSPAVFPALWLLLPAQLPDRHAAFRASPAPSSRNCRGPRLSALPHFSFRPPPLSIA